MKDFFDFDDHSYAIGRRIVEWKQEPGNMELVNQFLGVVVLEESAPAGDRKGVVCLTGAAPFSRKILTAALEKAGWTVGRRNHQGNRRSGLQRSCRNLDKAEKSPGCEDPHCHL